VNVLHGCCGMMEIMLVTAGERRPGNAGKCGFLLCVFKDFRPSLFFAIPEILAYKSSPMESADN
jgi:hypothetical protein